jgi:16S rRNA (uracil1498-N3)-methyltransferase
MHHRFFLELELTPGATFALTGEEAHHARVVRVGEGEEVEVFNARGASMFAKYAAGAVTITGAAPDREPRAEIHLAMAVIQLEKFELVLQKATELGVRSIIPLVCERGEVRPERYRGKGERWQKIVFEAVKQCGGSRIPLVVPPAAFADVVARDGHKIIFDADADAAIAQPGNPMTLFVGPEGGFTPRELALAAQHGAISERLGPRRLRAETAGIVAVASVAARLGDI